jgi:hypothetical protein
MGGEAMIRSSSGTFAHIPIERCRRPRNRKPLSPAVVAVGAVAVLALWGLGIVWFVTK